MKPQNLSDFAFGKIKKHASTAKAPARLYHSGGRSGGQKAFASCTAER
jgi:hypothetical protein